MLGSSWLGNREDRGPVVTKPEGRSHPGVQPGRERQDKEWGFVPGRWGARAGVSQTGWVSELRVASAGDL